MMDYLEKLAKIMTAPQDTGLPASSRITAMWLENWRPVNPPAESDWNMSSHSIASEMEDICPIPLEEISEVMLYLGYRLHCGGLYGPKWSMAPVDKYQ